MTSVSYADASRLCIIFPKVLVPVINIYLCLTVLDRTTSAEIHCWGSVTFWCGSGSGLYIPLTNGSGSNSGSDFFLQWLEGCKKRAHYLQSKKFIFLLKFGVKILFCKHCFSPLNSFMGKGKDPDLWLTDPYLDPGDPKTCRSRYLTLQKSNLLSFCVAAAAYRLLPRDLPYHGADAVWPAQDHRFTTTPLSWSHKGELNRDGLKVIEKGGG